MPDYSACRNKSCGRRATCARYLMVYGHWQSVSSFTAEGCTHYWGISEGQQFSINTVEEVDARISKSSECVGPGPD